MFSVRKLNCFPSVWFLKENQFFMISIGDNMISEIQRLSTDFFKKNVCPQNKELRLLSNSTFLFSGVSDIFNYKLWKFANAFIHMLEN